MFCKQTAEGVLPVFKIDFPARNPHRLIQQIEQRDTHNNDWDEWQSTAPIIFYK